ncbi:MFS transporter [Allobranchiibius sp. GilTou73]|uniref:MFS transporter n=1 Tax=Allobranchiibius sp. GilTou73 TaxID=2904523 RepID=UPI001F2D94C9|nr:MFS transporter [Allobranchiibius sp. GilTou73]UIJ34927.1 MFS transporter [Allobranchiibius sp. GilTou73]
MSPTFASLRIRNYRVYAAGALVSNIGTWMGRVAQDWLVLTQLTPHDSTDLGIVTALQFAPVVLLAPFAGAVSDRFHKRKVLIATQSALAITSALLAGLVLGNVVQLWHVYVLALLQGVATAFDNPTRQAFVSEMVPRERLANAVGLNSASFNAARLIGPGVAGLLIAAVGTGYTLVFNTGSFIAVLVALGLLRTSELRPSPRSSGKGRIREGLAYVRHRPDIVLVMVMVFMLGTFGMNFQITIALMSTSEFHEGATEYGLLGSIMAIGSLAAALMAARRPRPRLRILLVSLAGFTVASTAAALAPSFWFFALFLIPTGLCALTVLTTANATVQLGVSPEMRGRVMALYMAIFMGGTPLGSPVIGWIGGAWGPRWTILVGSIATGLTVSGAMVYLMRNQQLRLRIERQPLPHLPLVQVTAREVAREIIPERVA